MVFELSCWRRLLRVPWTARRSDQTILKEISPEYSLERLLLKLKLRYFGHLMWRTDSLEKTLMLGKIESRRSRGWQRMECIPNLMDMSLSKLWELVMDRKPGCAAVHGVTKSQISDEWTELSWAWTWSRKWQFTFQYSCLVNSMDRGDWQTAVFRVAKNWTLLSTHLRFLSYIK